MLTISAIILSSFFTAPAFAVESSCQNFAKNMTQHVVDIFHDSNQNEVEKRNQLAIIFRQAVDLDWIGKFVLGRFWRNASADEKKQYLENYRAYIIKNYISKFNDTDGMSIDDITISSVTPAPQETDQFEAKTLIKRKGEEDVHVDYLLDQTSGKCQVHDIKLEGISLLTSQRSEFAELAGKVGVKGVIEAMQKKISN